MKKSAVLMALLLMLTEINITQEKRTFELLNKVKVTNNIISIFTTGEVKYNIFKVSNPPRLVVELINTEHNWKQKEIVINGSVIKRIRSGQFQDEPVKIARVVIDLIKMADYEAKADGGKITISLANEISAQESTETTEVTATKETSTSPISAEAKEAIVSTPVANKLPKETQLKKVVKKKTAKAVPEKKALPGIVFPKINVTLEYQEADITDVLQIMAIRSGINIIYGSDVTGTITISLRDVPFEQAFNTILNLKGLAAVTVADNVIKVVTPAALASERAQAVTYTKIFPLNYALADEIQQQISTALTAAGHKLTLSIDKRTNSLVITTTSEGLILAERLIKELDTKPYQVAIEAKVIDIKLDDLKEIGVNWKYSSMARTGTGVTSEQKISETIGPGGITWDGSRGAGEVSRSGIEVGGIPIPAAGGMFHFGIISDRAILSAKLAMLATQDKIKLLSNPKIVTLNNKEAKILVGEKMPYKTVTLVPGGGATEKWDFINVGIELNVLPTINPDKVITLKVKPVVGVPRAAAIGAPAQVATRETEATVMVANNDTLVIGGLISEQDMANIQKVPLLAELPILGYLFKYKKDQTIRTELVIFITPTIIE